MSSDVSFGEGIFPIVYFNHTTMLRKTNAVIRNRIILKKNRTSQTAHAIGSRNRSTTAMLWWWWWWWLVMVLYYVFFFFYFVGFLKIFTQFVKRLAYSLIDFKAIIV